MTTPADALNIHAAPGSNFFNIGVGRASAHTDYDLATVAAGYESAPEFVENFAGDAVRFQVSAGAARTSTNTKYPRSELRELNPDGSKASWDGRKGTHRLSGVSRVLHLPPKKPWVCIAQIHDAASDLMRLQVEAGKLVCRNTAPGSSSETTKTVQAVYRLGDPIVWDINVIDGLGSLYIGGQLVQHFPAGESGLYFKAGCYLQTNVKDVGESASEYGLVEILNGTLTCWHTGYAIPAPGPTPVPVPVPPPTPAPPPSGTVLLVLRHAEKPKDKNDHTLNATGRLRATALAEFFTRPNGPLPVPQRIYASKGNTSSMRPLQTVQPLAARLGLTINTKFDVEAAESATAKELKGLTGVTVMCMEHSAIVGMCKALGTASPKLPKEWDSKRFDMVWVFTKTAKGWDFTQVPELVLAGDSSKPMK